MILFGIGIVVSIVDGVAYSMYTRDVGVGFLEIVPWSVFRRYVATFPGNLLTTLLIALWGGAFVVLYWPKQSNRTKTLHLRRKAEQEAG